MAIVYLLTNLENGKHYVGKTKGTLDKRWYKHVQEAKKGCPFALHCAIRKYGSNSFRREVLVEYATEEEALRAESLWIEKFQAFGPKGYNLSEGGRGNPGFKRSPETREKDRKNALARPPRVHSEDTKAKMRAAQQARRERDPVTDEFRETMRRTRVAQPIITHPTPEQNAKRSASLKAAWATKMTDERKLANELGIDKRTARRAIALGADALAFKDLREKARDAMVRLEIPSP